MKLLFKDQLQSVEDYYIEFMVNPYEKPGPDGPLYDVTINGATIFKFKFLTEISPIRKYRVFNRIIFFIDSQLSREKTNDMLKIANDTIEDIKDQNYQIPMKFIKEEE